MPHGAPNPSAGPRELSRPPPANLRRLWRPGLTGALTLSSGEGYTRGSQLNVSIDKAAEAILFLIALILSITVHEFGHALVASKLGDSVPRSQGRLTLSPLRHIDPIGTILFPLLMVFTGIPLLGWGRPVETNPNNYTRRFSRLTGHMLVALAGPGMNLLMAVLVSALVVLGARTGVMTPGMGGALIGHMVQLNLGLMFFNLLPIPPLDGGAVLAWLLPRSMHGLIDFLSRWGFLILMGLMFTGTLGYLMIPGAMVSRWWIIAVVRAAGS